MGTTAGCYVNNTGVGVAVDWSASAGATFYNIYRSLSSNSPYGSGQNIATTSSLSYYNGSLSYGTTYYYTVSALNAGGESLQTYPASQAITPSYCIATCSNGAPNPLNGTSNYPACSCPLGPEVNGVCTSTSTPAIIPTFLSKPTTVNKGNPCHIYLKVSDASQCSLSGTNGDNFDISLDSNGSVDTSITSGNITTDTKYNLTCTGKGKGLDGNDIITNDVTNCHFNPNQKEI